MRPPMAKKNYLKPAIQPFDPVAAQIPPTKVVGTEQAIDMPREMFSSTNQLCFTMDCKKSPTL